MKLFLLGYICGAVSVIVAILLLAGYAAKKWDKEAREFDGQEWD
jgi:uncharacterized membrane protein YkgB